MTGNPAALDLLRHFFKSAGFQEAPATKTYTRDDLVPTSSRLLCKFSDLRRDPFFLSTDSK
jgi:hypothetical protein